MIPSRWSSAVAILRRRLATEEEERRLLHERKMLDHDADTKSSAGEGNERDDDVSTQPAFIVRWFLPQRP